MAEHNTFGNEGENAAAEFLIEHGYHIRTVIGEVDSKELDIEAEKGNNLIIVEVKSRKDTAYAMPEDAVDTKKIRRIVSATDAYLRCFSLDAKFVLTL